MKPLQAFFLLPSCRVAHDMREVFYFSSIVGWKKASGNVMRSKYS